MKLFQDQIHSPGGVCGVILGYILSYLPPKSPNQASIQTLLLSLAGFGCVFGLKRASYSGAGVLAALVMSTVAAQTWQTKVGQRLAGKREIFPCSLWSRFTYCDEHRAVVHSRGVVPREFNLRI